MSELTPVQISLGLAGTVTAVCYVVFILVPALGSYGRVWEKLAAGFLTLFILASLVGLGVLIGGAIVWTYDRWA